MESSKTRLLFVVLFHTAFASFGEIEANVLNYLAVPVRQFFADSLQERYGIQPDSDQFELVYSAVASIYFVGAIFGGLLMAPCMDYYGRKGTAVYIRSFLGVLSAVCMLLANWMRMIELFALGHFIAGFIATWKIALFIYLSECAPDHSRGWSTAAIGSGSNLALLFMSPLCLPSVFGNPALWWMLPLLALLLAACHLLISARFPESPKHLYCRHNVLKRNSCRDKAKLSIQFYHGSTTNVTQVLDGFELEWQLTHREDVKFKDFWKNNALRYCLAITLCTSFVYVFSLTSLKSQYMESMLMRYGLNQSEAMISTMLITALAAPCCFFSPFLIERWGRRPLFMLITLCSTLELAMVTGAQALYDITGGGGWVASLSAVIGCTLGQSSSNLGIFHMTPILTGELLPHAARSKTVQINMLLASPVIIFIVMAYPPLIGPLGALFFLPLTLFSALMLWIIYRWLPETKGLPVNTIFRRLAKSVTDYNSSDVEDSDDEGKMLISKQRFIVQNLT